MVRPNDGDVNTARRARALDDLNEWAGRLWDFAAWLSYSLRILNRQLLAYTIGLGTDFA